MVRHPYEKGLNRDPNLEELPKCCCQPARVWKVSSGGFQLLKGKGLESDVEFEDLVISCP